jgi:uncharacterized caspase-like protein
MAVLCAVLALPAAAKRVALVVGIDRYDHLADGLQLKKAANDAKAVGDTLGSLGYEVIRAENVGRVELLRQWSRFLNAVEPGSTAAFFFAGHGVEIGGVNYLIPRDVPRVGDGEEELLKGAALKLDMLLEGFRARKPAVSLIVLDACRDNPFVTSRGRSLGGSRGLADVRPPAGTFIMYSAGAGQRAIDRLSDADPDANSIYTRHLLPKLRTPGLGIQEIARQVRREVMETARGVGHEQMPAYYDEVTGDFCPAGCAPPAGDAKAEAERQRLALLQQEVERLRAEAKRKEDAGRQGSDGKARTAYTGELVPPNVTEYIAFRSAVLAREGPAGKYAGTFTLRQGQKVRVLGSVYNVDNDDSDADFPVWLKFATVDGHEGFVRETDLMNLNEFKDHLEDLAANKRIDSYLHRMRNATGPLARVTGIYGSKCSILDLGSRRDQTTFTSVLFVLQGLHLVWSEGDILYYQNVDRKSERPSAFKFTRNRTVSLKRLGPVQLYALTPLEGGDSKQYGFTGKHMVVHDKGDSFHVFDHCGSADSDAPGKLRSLLAIRAEHSPKSYDAK